MTPNQFKAAFPGALFRGSMFITGVAAGCLFVLQIVYGLGWGLYSVLPKHGAHIVSILGIEKDFAGSHSVPTTAWLFASDSYPALLTAGVALLIVLAVAVFGIFVIAELGGWRNPRLEAFRQWLNT